MTIGNRRLDKGLFALFHVRHYRALWNMATTSGNFVGILKRYLFDIGSYPFEITLQTPIGKILVTTYSHHDVLTVNEIFFRGDYTMGDNGRSTRCVVDIGANIGISALYFLTRNRTSRVYLFEPDPRNIEKLLGHIRDFNSRVIVVKKAVSNYSGTAEFAIEESGRYGGIGRSFRSKIQVECIDINEALEKIVSDEQKIDVVKIDTEGLEYTLLDSIQDYLLEKIGVIFYEKDEVSKERQLSASIRERFDTRKYGPIRILNNRSWN